MRNSPTWSFPAVNRMYWPIYSWKNLQAAVRNGVNIFEVRNSGRDSKRQAIYDLFHCLIYWVNMWKTLKNLNRVFHKLLSYRHLIVSSEIGFFPAKSILSFIKKKNRRTWYIIFHNFYYVRHMNIWPAIKLHIFIIPFNKLMIHSLFCLWLRLSTLIRFHVDTCC